MRRMIQIFSDSFQITKSDLLDFVRDRARLISFTLMPIFMMIMMGYIFPSQASLRDIPLGIVNNDKGKLAQNLIKPLQSLEMSEANGKAFRLITMSSEREAKEEIKSQAIGGAVVFPADFSERIARNRQAEIILITDQSNPQISSMLTTVFNQMVEKASVKIGAEKVAGILKQQRLLLKGKTSSDFNPRALVKPLVFKTKGVVPGRPNYFEFMAPGIMVMVVIMAVIMGLAGSIAREKELGTLDGILVAPIRRISIILGKATSQTIRGLVQGSLVLLLATLLFDVRVYGSLLLVVLLLITSILCFIGLGILVSATVAEQETAMTVMMTLTFPMFFLSGTFFPIQQMPRFMQVISKLLPITYAVQALRKVIVLGAGFPAVLTELFILLSFGLVTLVVAVPAFNKVITR